jgi:hypothetical protein
MSQRVSSKEIQVARRNAKRTRSAVACVRCKMGKIKCSDYRPCKGCVISNKSRTCEETSVKKRKILSDQTIFEQVVALQGVVHTIGPHALDVNLDLADSSNISSSTQPQKDSFQAQDRQKLLDPDGEENTLKPSQNIDSKERYCALQHISSTPFSSLDSISAAGVFPLDLLSAVDIRKRPTFQNPYFAPQSYICTDQALLPQIKKFSPFSPVPHSLTGHLGQWQYREYASSALPPLPGNLSPMITNLQPLPSLLDTLRLLSALSNTTASLP